MMIFEGAYQRFKQLVQLVILIDANTTTWIIIDTLNIRSDH